MSEDIFFTRSWDWSNRRLNLKFLQVPAKVQYLLYDTFVTAVAAGSVNNTTSESPVGTGGGVTRTVIDAENKLSITGGQLSFAGGKATPAAGDPGLWYSSLARVTGMVEIISITGTVASSYLYIGYDANQSGAPTADYNGFDAGNPTAYPENVTIAAKLTNSVTYSLCTITRGTGKFYLIKGGAYTNWNLWWPSSTGTTATLYPVIANYSMVFNVISIRIPVPTYILTPLAYDTFTRGDGVLGSSETTGPDSQVTPALAWTDQVGTWTVTSNKAQASALTSGSAAATVPTSSADVIIDVVPVWSAGNSGLIARYANNLNYLTAYTDGTNAKLDKVVAGTTTNLISAAVTYGATKVLRLILSGTEARLFYNNLAVGTLATAPASTSVNHGVYTTDITNTQDTFAIWARGTSNEYGWLDGV